MAEFIRLSRMLWHTGGMNFDPSLLTLGDCFVDVTNTKFINIL
jgi:hypothetical protein